MYKFSQSEVQDMVLDNAEYPVGKFDPTEDLGLKLSDLEQRVEKIESQLFPWTRNTTENRQSDITDKLIRFAEYLDINKKYAEADRITKVIERFV